MKSDIPTYYVKKNDDATINGSLTISSANINTQIYHTKETSNWGRTDHQYLMLTNNNIPIFKMGSSGDIHIMNDIYLNNRLIYANNISDPVVPMPINSHPTNPGNFTITFPYPIAYGTIECNVSIGFQLLWHEWNIHFKNNEIINADELSKQYWYSIGSNSYCTVNAEYNSNTNTFKLTSVAHSSGDNVDSRGSLKGDYFDVDFYLFTRSYYAGNPVYSNDH